MSEAFITCSSLSFAWPDGTPVFDNLSFSVAAGRTGLVAPNGAGKSTLLRLITGELAPSAGSVHVAGRLGYLPQTLPFTAELTVAEVLGVQPTLDALEALAAGDAREEVFATIGDDWDIEERSREVLARVGLPEVELDRRLGGLSGGEVVRLGLAAELLRRPDVLILDEPTNNLDLDARQHLYDVVEDWKGCLLVVSHDRSLLERMDRIAELYRGEVRFYGGSFSVYQAALRAEQEAAVRNLRSAKQQLRRERRERQIARERAARRSGTAARNVKDAGLPKIVAGAMKRRAQESAGKADDVHEARLEAARKRLDEAESAVRDDPEIDLDLPHTTVPTGRMVLSAKGLQVRLGGRPLLADEGVDLVIKGPERIALIGANGSGKTTLLRVINGDLPPDRGELRRGAGRVAYLSQRLDLLDPDRTLEENVADFAPSLTLNERRHLLARFLFRGDRVHLPAGVLSSGELLRATLACVLYAEPAPQLLLLDEPTNNLDLVSVGQLESALRAYRGAFVVVSHDQRFLAEIGVNRWLRVQDGRLEELPDLEPARLEA